MRNIGTVAAVLVGLWAFSKAAPLMGFVLSIGVLLYIIAVAFLAPNGHFVTFRPEEGKAKVVVKGADENGRGGVFVRFIMSWNDYTFDDDGFGSPYGVVLKSAVRGVLSEESWYDKILGLFGLAWVGIPGTHSIYKYHFEWAEYQQGEDGKYKLVKRSELTELIFLKPTQYVVVAPDAEVGGNIPVDLKYVLTIRIVNPYKALFVADSWLVRTATATNGKIVPWLRQKEFEDVNTGSDEEMVGAVTSLNENNRMIGDQECGLTEEFGVAIDDVEISEFDPKGSAETREALVAQKVATERAAARKITAEGDAAYIRETGEAQAEAIGKVVEKVEGKGWASVVALLAPVIADKLFGTRGRS